MKDNINRGWDEVATFVSTFPDGDGTGACDVSVQTAQGDDGQWYIRTTDDAGGSDDCDDTAYASREEAANAAQDYANEHDESDGETAEKYLARIAKEAIESGKSDDGEYVLVHKDGSRWDDDRYVDRDAADGSIKAWYAAVQSANPGTDIIWHLMDTPELAHLNEDGSVEILNDEE